MRSQRLTLACVIALAAAAASPARATDWLQFGYDTVHSGFNRAENGYPTSNGNTVAFHYALSSAYGTIDSAPVYLENVATSAGQKNLLFVVTKNGYVVALDADSDLAPSVVWSSQPQVQTDTKFITTGAPAIDPSRQFVYAYALDGKVYKYQVGDGAEITSGGWPQTSTLKPDVEKGAAGLSIATAQDGNTYLYSVTDGYVGDGGDYQGHLTTINLATGAQKVFNSLCSDLDFHFVENGVVSGSSRTDCASPRNGIWGRPGAVYDADRNLVFITTGNGPFQVDAGNGIYNWGDSVLALNPDGSGGATLGMPVDSYTPSTAASLQSHDADLGSESIAIVPPPPGADAQHQHLAVQAGKDGCVRLINLDDLSGHGAPGFTGGEIQALNISASTSHCATGADGPEIRAQPAVWVSPANASVWVYIASRSAGFVAYQVTASAGAPSLAVKWSKGDNEGSSPVVANGVVYYLGNSQLRAFDAVTGAARVTGGAWTSTSIAGQHWQSPILVNGRFYIFDNTDPSSLWVFQLDGAFKNGFD